MLGCLLWQRLAVNSDCAGSNHRELNLSYNFEVERFVRGVVPRPLFSADKITRGSVQAAPRTSLRRGILDDDEGRNARVSRDTGAGGETASQVKERVHFNAVGAATRAAVRRRFGEPVGGARPFDQKLGVLRFESFENLVECLCLCFRSFHTLHSPLAAINGGGKRKAETNFREKYSSENLIFSFWAGKEVRAPWALMVGDFGWKLSGEDAANGVVVMFEASVDGALAQVKFDDFIG